MFNKLPKPTPCLHCETRAFSWFHSGTDKQLQQRENRRTGQYIVPANQYLFTEGANNNKTYTLKEGWAICYKQFKNGQRQIVYIALPGDLVGYTPDPHAPMDYSVMAVTECTFCAFAGITVQQLAVTDVELLNRLMVTQTRQSQAHRSYLLYVGQAQAKERLAAFLLDLILRLRRRGFVESIILIPLARTDIADAIGVTRVHLGRIIVELNQQGIVECRHNKLHIKDFDALKRLVDC